MEPLIDPNMNQKRAQLELSIQRIRDRTKTTKVGIIEKIVKFFKTSGVKIFKTTVQIS